MLTLAAVLAASSAVAQDFRNPGGEFGPPDAGPAGFPPPGARPLDPPGSGPVGSGVQVIGPPMGPNNQYVPSPAASSPPHPAPAARQPGDRLRRRLDRRRGRDGLATSLGQQSGLRPAGQQLDRHANTPDERANRLRHGHRGGAAGLAGLRRRKRHRHSRLAGRRLYDKDNLSLNSPAQTGSTATTTYSAYPAGVGFSAVSSPNYNDAFSLRQRPDHGRDRPGDPLGPSPGPRLAGLRGRRALRDTWRRTTTPPGSRPRWTRRRTRTPRPSFPATTSAAPDRWPRSRPAIPWAERIPAPGQRPRLAACSAREPNGRTWSPWTPTPAETSSARRSPATPSRSAARCRCWSSSWAPIGATPWAPIASRSRRRWSGSLVLRRQRLQQRQRLRLLVPAAKPEHPGSHRRGRRADRREHVVLSFGGTPRTSR